MKRRLLFLVFLPAFVPLLPAQSAPNQPNPAPQLDILGPQLIAWSQLQQPQPLQQSGQSSQSERQTEATLSTQPAPSPATQTLTGTIVSHLGHYVLKVSGSTTTYELDDQLCAQKYEGKQVKLAGTLDAKGNSFHIVSIELLS